jgi:transcriptional regulator
MFIPHQFKNENITEVHDFIQRNSFGILINIHDGRPLGVHIPMMLETTTDGKTVLTGHVAKANTIHSTFENENDALAIFNGPHAYISSSWYDHDNVSTWNYIAVHLYGRLSIMDDMALADHLQKLVDKYEQHMDAPRMYKDLGRDSMRQIKGIVGFRMDITEVQAAYKLSQNRSDSDYHNIVNELSQSVDENDVLMAKLLEERRLKI